MSCFRVGVFDSGIGGLTVLRECVRLMPDCRYYYLGDNDRAPYGNRPPEEILSYVREALDRFLKLGVDAAVLACNTATAVCAETVRREYPFPIVGTEPALRPAARACRRALVLATPATCASARMQALVAQNPACAFTLFPVEGLASAVERAACGEGAPDLKKYLPEGEFDGIVLGCTHYVFLKEQISKYYLLPTYDGNEGVALRLRSLLLGCGCEKKGKNGFKLGNLTTNKRLQKMGVKRAKKGVFFIGSTKKHNKTIYKQMFIMGFSAEYPEKTSISAKKIQKKNKNVVKGG